MRTAAVALAFAMAAGCAVGAQAQTYPSSPVTLVVPFPPGGPTDTVGRVMADHMKTTLGQTVVVENVTGAGGTIGMARVARAAPDGYTLSIGQWTHPCRRRRDLSAAIPRPARFRAGIAADLLAALDRGQE